MNGAESSKRQQGPFTKERSLHRESVVSRIWLSHVINMSSSFHSYEWGCDCVVMMHVKRAGLEGPCLDDCHAYDSVMSSIWLCHSGWLAGLHERTRTQWRVKCFRAANCRLHRPTVIRPGLGHLVTHSQWYLWARHRGLLTSATGHPDSWPRVLRPAPN